MSPTAPYCAPFPILGLAGGSRWDWCGLSPAAGQLSLNRRCGWRAQGRPPASRAGSRDAQGHAAVKNGFSFFLQTPIQQQRWLRQTLCLFPWARGRYVLTSPLFRLSLCAGREQGEGQSPSSRARKAAQRAVRQGRAQETGTPALCPWECASCLLKYLPGVFCKAPHSILGQPCPALTRQLVTGSYRVPKSHRLLFTLPCPCR